VNLSEVLNAINYNKENIFSSLPDVTNKEYVPFVINKSLSYFPDTILQANNMNIRPHVDERMQFHYLMNSIRKKKRFSRWQKSNTSKEVEAIMSCFGYNIQRAEEVLSILTQVQIDQILEIEESK